LPDVILSNFTAEGTTAGVVAEEIDGACCGVPAGIHHGRRKIAGCARAGDLRPALGPLGQQVHSCT
jgi:hypothetical protein